MDLDQPVPGLPLVHLPPVLGRDPRPEFSELAAAVVDDLRRRTDLDLWMVTHVEDDGQVVVASAGRWASLAEPGTVFGWAHSFCRLMGERGRPEAVPDVEDSPEHVALAVGVRAAVRAYLGVPLTDGGGRLYGSLCAYHGTPVREALGPLLPHVDVLGRLLSALLSDERDVGRLREQAVAARALADRDHLTGLRNRRAWEDALVVAEGCSGRAEARVSLLVLDLDGLKQLNDVAGHAVGDVALVRCAQVLAAAVRPEDLVARLGGDEFGVLVADAEEAGASALARRLVGELDAAGVEASVGVATRAGNEDVWATWRRADADMYRAKRRRRR